MTATRYPPRPRPRPRRRVPVAATGALILLSALSAASAQRAPAADPPRAMWVWNSEDIRTDPSTQAKFFQFLDAPRGDADHAIGALFFDGIETKDFQDPATAANVRAFLKAAHARHLRVDYLTGYPQWVQAAHMDEGIANLRALLAFNQAGAPDERYDGVQYDVEPYVLPGWNTDKAPIEAGLLRLLDRCDALLKASGGHPVFSVAIPRWYGDVDGRHLDRDVIDRTDEVAVMDYVTNADSLVDDPSDILNYSDQVHKKVWIGVETIELKDTPQATFHDGGNAALEGVLTAARARLAAHPSFAGYAIHYWTSYNALKP